MSISRKLLSIFLISVLLGVFGYLIGSFVSHGLLDGRWARWQALDSPPGGAASFAGMQLVDQDHQAILYVETGQGQIYRRSTPSQDAWQPTDELPPANPSYTFQFTGTCPEAENTRANPYYANLHGRVKYCTVIHWSWEWVADDTHYAILEDGSVWMWNYTASLNEALCLPAASPLVAIVVGWIAIALLRRRKKKESHEGLSQGTREH